MDLYNRDHIRIAKRLRGQPILALARSLGLFSPKETDIKDDALFGKQLFKLWQHYSGSSTKVIYVDRMITVGYNTSSDSTIMIVDRNDLDLNFSQTKLLSRCDNTTFVKLGACGRLFNFGLPPIKTIKNGFYSEQPLTVIDRSVQNWITLNTTVGEFEKDLQKDFDILSSLISDQLKNLDNGTFKNWSSPRNVTKCLCVTTKSDGKTLEWRVKNSYFDKITGINSIMACPDIIR